MDFTREPVIETIITPREGFRLVVRSSKSVGQEEHFVDSVEVVSFGKAAFFRSTERPKPFLVPVSDYEVLEVREQRLILKAKTPEQVKIAGGREAGPRRETRPSPGEVREEFIAPEQKGMEGPSDGRSQRRRDRRNRFRRRPRGEFGEGPVEEGRALQETTPEEAGEPQEATLPPSPRQEMSQGREMPQGREQEETPPPVFRTVLPPPSTLIRDDLQRLRENVEYRGAFYLREEESAREDEALPSGPFPEELPPSGPMAKEVPPQEESFLDSPPSEASPRQDVVEPPQ